jgi:hypothetical protein
VALLDDRRCGPVQERLRKLVQDKLADAHEQVAALMAFTAQLQQAEARLRPHDPDAPCDGDCGCTTDVAPGGDGADAVLVPLGSKPAAGDEVPIACSLGPGEVHRRVADWQAALGAATAREAVDGGVRVHLPRRTPLGPLAALVEAEEACCPFFTFSLTIGADGIRLDVTGPPGAEEVVHALVGVPS